MLEGNAGAFIWIASQAEDSAELIAKVENAMQKLGLNINDSEQVQKVLNEDDLSEAVAELIPQARRDKESVVCGTWHKFKNHDA
ncbi:hypothetical protein [Tunturiibacter gelidoferens]|nr:hypothetical protein [Edaphobacter lichenicola]MBB5339058.1 peptidase E [Edaphobacter lichenicola]